MVEALVEQAAFLTPTSLFLLLNVVIATILLSSALTHHRGQGSGDISATAALPRLARTPSLFSRVTSFNFSNYYPQEHQIHDQTSHSHTTPLFSRVSSFKFSGWGNEPGQYEESTPDPAVARAPSFLSRVASFGPRGMGTGRAKVGEIDAHPDNKNSMFELESTAAPVEEVRRNVTSGPSLLSRVASFGLYRQATNVTSGPSLLSRVVSFGLSREATTVQVGEVDTHLDYNSSGVGSTSAHMKKKKKKRGNKETANIRRDDGEVDAKADDFINRFKHQLKLQRIESLMRSKTA